MKGPIRDETSWDPGRLEASLLGLASDGNASFSRRAAVAVILHFAEEAEVLLMKRAARSGDPWSGQISLPGGRSEPEDPDLLTTAMRETIEEVGVDLNVHGQAVGRLAPMRARARGKLLEMDVSPFVFRAREKPSIAIGEEADEAFWFPIERAASGVFDQPFSYLRDGVERRLPSWHFAGHTVWGMTHMILSQLIGHMAPGR